MRGKHSNRDNGAALLEYVILIAFLAVVAIFPLQSLQNEISTKFCKASGKTADFDGDGNISGTDFILLTVDKTGRNDINCDGNHWDQEDIDIWANGY